MTLKKHNYNRVTRFREARVWLKEVEKIYAQFLKGYYPVIHLFCGKSSLGDVRFDCENFSNVTHRLEIKPTKSYKLPFDDKSFDACILELSWINPYFAWTAREIPRITKRRIIVAITGIYWWKPREKRWKLSKLDVLIRLSEQIPSLVKLVLVYDYMNKTFEEGDSDGN